MSQPITVFVDSGRAVARLSGPLILGDTYAVSFSGLSTAEAAASPEIVVLAPKPGEIAARSGSGKVLAMTTRPCADVFRLPPPPPFPNPPPTAPRPLHPRGGPHASAPMHFYVVAGGQTLAQGDLVLLWAPFEYDSAGNPIQLQGEKGDKGDKGDTGAQGEPGRNGVYVAMDGLYAFHISERGDHPEDGHLWIHAQDESRLYAHDENGNYLTDSDGKRIPLYYIDGRGHLLYRFFYKDSTHTELDLGRVVTREGLYAFHISDGTDGEPDGHLMMHGQDLSQLYATDADGELILDGDGNPIPLFHIDGNGHLIYTFYGVDGQAHATLDIGDVRGLPLTWDDLTEAQKASLKGETGATGAQGPKGEPLTWDDLTEAQKAALKGEKGDPGEDGMSTDEIVALVKTTMGRPDDAPIAGSGVWVTSGGLWSVEMAILARIAALKERIDALRQQIGAALHFKGSVATFDDLPENADAGDCYSVLDEGGMNYAWTGSEWDALGATIDLSAYRTAAAQDAIDQGKANVQHTHAAIISPNGNTSLSATDGGTVTITTPGTGYGNAFVTFPAGFSISWGGDTYSTDHAETVEFVGPYNVSGSYFWVPSGTSNPESFDPSANQVWCLYSYSGSTPAMLMYKTGPYYDITNWESETPTLTLNMGTASGGSPTATRGPATATKTVATTDQIPSLANYVEKSQTAGLLKNDGTVDTNTYLTSAPVTSVNGQTGAVSLTIPDVSGKLDATKRNLLDYTSGTTLAPGTAVYRSSLALDGTFPTIVDTAITTANAYFQFELELGVPSAVPSTITGPSGWVWIDGHGLPDPADLSGGETICISVRLDCTARTFLASVWRVA